MFTLKAAKFATEAHKGQFRKDGVIPYITHPMRVAMIVARCGGDSSLIMAAYLHDVIEDTQYTYDDILQKFGVTVAELVLEVTNVFIPKHFPNMDRRERKRKETNGLSLATKKARLLKLADRLDNLHDVEDMKGGFRRMYLEESEALVQALEGTDKELELVLRCRIESLKAMDT